MVANLPGKKPAFLPFDIIFPFASNFISCWTFGLIFTLSCLSLSFESCSKWYSFLVFLVQGIWDVEQASKGENSCTVKVYSNVAFSKKTMFKGTIAEFFIDFC